VLQRALSLLFDEYLLIEAQINDKSDKIQQVSYLCKNPSKTLKNMDDARLRMSSFKNKKIL